jgi:hypothetical protein
MQLWQIAKERKLETPSHTRVSCIYILKAFLQKNFFAISKRKRRI